MKKLDHQNVVKLYNYFYDKGDFFLVMEYMDGGSLYELIIGYINLHIKVEEEKLWNIFEQCLKGLIYLHEQGLIHRNIKPANLLINNKGEIKYYDFSSSAIDNLYKTSLFTKDKIKRKNLLNQMTKVYSGKFGAPEIFNQNKYDLKIDVYSLGKTFGALAFFDIDFPDYEKLKSLDYSKELIEIIREMIEINPSKRPSSREIYNKFIKFYIEKYISNSGLIECIFSLFSSPSIYNFFENSNIQKENMTQFPLCQKLYEIFTEMEFQYKNIYNKNIIIYNKGKKTIYHLIYDLRNLLLKIGKNIIKAGNNEINPINLIAFLLKKLHYELNIFNSERKKGNLKANFTKVIYAENQKLEAYESYKKNYTSNFESIISQEFYGLIKIKQICKNCEKIKLKHNYLFNVLCYIPFDVKILAEMTQNKKDLNLYDAFTCLNYNIMKIKEYLLIQCEKCKKSYIYKELKQFYNLSKNLVIIFDRGENYINKTFVDFPEDLYLDGSFVENFKNIKVKYNLMSIICIFEEEENESKRKRKKFVVFKRINNSLFLLLYSIFKCKKWR